MFRRKISLLSLLIGGIFAVNLLLFIPTARGAGGFTPFPIDITPSASSQTVNGKITVNIFLYQYLCDGGIKNRDGKCSEGPSTTKVGEAEQNVGLYVSGSGNTVEGMGTKSGVPYAVTDGNGKAQFTVSSSVVETKTIQAVHFYSEPSAYSGASSVNVAFTAPPAAAAPKKVVPTPAPTPAPAPVAPETPKPTEMQISGQAVTDSENITLDSEEPLVLGGKTVPNGVIKLFIFSTPREATVTANAEGVWSYTVQGLESGSHHIEAEVTDPKTNLTSPRSTIASFTVKAAPKKATQTQTTMATTSKASKLPWIIGGLVILAVGGLVFWWWKRRKHIVPSDNSSDTTGPLPGSGSGSTE